MAAQALAERLARLRYDPRDPASFYGERSALAREVTMLAVPASPVAIRYETPDPKADDRVKRLQALLAARTHELAQLRRLLATVQSGPRRRRPADERQHSLFATTMEHRA